MRMYSDGNRIVQQVGERTSGGAYAEFRVIDGFNNEIGNINFQHNTISDVGVVGWTNECLLAVVADRLQSFQDGPFPCEENQIALESVKRALFILEKRTADRKNRGVEGQHIK